MQDRSWTVMSKCCSLTQCTLHSTDGATCLDRSTNAWIGPPTTEMSSPLQLFSFMVLAPQSVSDLARLGMFDTLSDSIQSVNFANKSFIQYFIFQYCFTQKMTNIDSKYDSFIHFTIKFNSKDYSISIFQEYSMQKIIQ